MKPKPFGQDLEVKMLKKELGSMVAMLAQTTQFKSFADKYWLENLWLIETPKLKSHEWVPSSAWDIV